jgi:acyl-CoA reductase-like NAD-dependent aldehyde dehydrogenase
MALPPSLGVSTATMPKKYDMTIGGNRIAIWHIVPAIRTGNTVVIKPSPYTPSSTLRLVELINEVVPHGLVNVISGGDELDC